MRYIFILIIPVFFLNTTVNSQISEGGIPLSFNKSNIHANIPTIAMPGINIKQLIYEDSIESSYKTVPFRFGKDINVNLNTENSGIWQTLKDGGRIWQLGIHSNSAFSLNFIFNKFRLPEGSKLFIYNSDKTAVLGAFTYKNNRDDGVFATTLIKGDNAILEYYEPQNVKGKGIIQLSKVIHAYKDLFKQIKGFGGSESCNVNVNCVEGLPWYNEKRAVAMILESDNTRICTGALLNNVREDGTPYLLTANHCAEGEDVNTWIFMFNYESSGCFNQDGPINQTTQGAVLRSTDTPSDFALLELAGPLPKNYNVYYAGWTAIDSPSDSCAVIHHPNGDIKKISFENDLIVSSDWVTGVDGSHWDVPFYVKGSTERGSSGSPLFDKNHKITGQLHGGTASCVSTSNDYFGKFAYSWNKGTTSSKRIKDWLDPDNTGTLVLEGKDFNHPVYNNDAAISVITKPEQADICNDSITPEIIIKNNGSLDLTSASIFYKLDDGNFNQYDWKGRLKYMYTKSIKLNPVYFSKGEHSLTVYITSPNDSIDKNNSNDTLTVNFNSITGKNLTLTLKTDYSAKEISWVIRDSLKNTLFTNTPLSSKTLYTTEHCFAYGCYTFTIFDSSGDGMCETSGPDSAYVSLSFGNILLGHINGCDYDSSSTIHFCINKDGININKLTNENSFQIFPNPGNGELYLDYNSAKYKTASCCIYSISGKLIGNFKVYDKKRLKLEFPELPGGLYFITVQNEAIIYKRKFIIIK